MAEIQESPSLPVSGFYLEAPVSEQFHPENEYLHAHHDVEDLDAEYAFHASPGTDIGGSYQEMSIDMSDSMSLTMSDSDTSKLSECDDSDETSTSGDLSTYCSTSDLSTTTHSSLSNNEEESENEMSNEEKCLNESEIQALTILSCFLRNNLAASACKDILDTIKGTMGELFPNSKELSILNLGNILSHIDISPVQEVHYCILCNEVFPENTDKFRCSTVSCKGLRYKGPESSQHKKGRQPRQCFVMADTRKQLINLLQTPGKLHKLYHIYSFNTSRQSKEIWVRFFQQTYLC